MWILNNFAISCIALFRFPSVSYKSNWNAAKNLHTIMGNTLYCTFFSLLIKDKNVHVYIACPHFYFLLSNVAIFSSVIGCRCINFSIIVELKGKIQNIKTKKKYWLFAGEADCVRNYHLNSSESWGLPRSHVLNTDCRAHCFLYCTVQGMLLQILTAIFEVLEDFKENNFIRNVKS